MSGMYLVFEDGVVRVAFIHENGYEEQIAFGATVQEALERAFINLGKPIYIKLEPHT